MFVREADEAYALGPASARPYLDLAVLERALVACRGGRRLGRLGLRRRGPRVRRPVRPARRHLHRPERRGDAQARRQDRLQADRRGGRRPGRAVEPRAASTPSRTRSPRPTEIGYPLMLKATAGGGGRGIRMVDSAAELEDAYQRTRDEAERAFGSGVVFLERLVTGARHVEVQVIADSHGTAWARRRPRLLGAAPQPEGDRGVRLAAARREPDRRAQGLGRAARARGRLRRRRHRRVPLPPGRAHVRVPRGQHPAPGRAPDHRGDHRPRPGQGAAPRRRRRPARGREAAPRRATPSRPGSTPRTRTATSRRRPGRIALLELPVGPGHPGRHRRRRGRHHPRRLRLDDRQDHRLRPHPRRGAGPAAPRDVRDHRRDRGRRHQQELHPRPARPARGRSTATARLGRHRLDRPGPRRGPAASSHEHSGIAWSPPASRPTRTRRQVEITRLLETAHGGRPQVQHKVGRAVDLKLRGTSYQVTVLQIGPHRFRVTVGRRRRRARRGRRVERLDEFHTRLTRRRPALPAGHRHPRARCTWSRSTASPTGSAATRAACCARPPRRWWSPRPSRSATRSRPARRCWCWRA